MSESPQKKRKRSEESAERSRKSASSGVDKLKFTTIETTGKWTPVIAFSPGLEYGFQSSMNAYSRSRTTAIDSSNQELLLHSEDHPKLDYVAREEKAGDAESLLKHYVAVHDPQTGDTQIIPVRKLVLRSILQATRTSEVTEEQIPAQKSALNSRILLGQAFGTKKSQKALRSLTENAIVSPEKVKKDASGRLVLEDTAAVVIDTMGETTSIPSKEALQSAIDDAKPRPRANLSATTPSEVYPLRSLAGEDVYTRLDVSFLKNAVKKKQDVSTVSRYFSLRLARVAAEKVDDKLRALRLLLTLVEWLKTFKPGRRDTWMLSKDEDVKPFITEFDPGLMSNIKRKFAPEATISPWHMDNICTHICALALIVDNYTLDTFDLKTDLSLDTRKISQYFREIGCRTKPPTESDLKELGIKTKAEAKTHTIAKLRIPLQFPKMRAPMRR